MERKNRDLLSDLNDTKSKATFRTIKLGGEWNEFINNHVDIKFIGQCDSFVEEYNYQGMSIQRYKDDYYDILLSIRISIEDTLYISDITSIMGDEGYEFDTGKGDVFFTYGEREDKCMIIFKLSDGIESKVNSIDLASTIFMD